MGELYRCDKTSILNHAKQIGFDVHNIQIFKLTKQNKKDIIEAYETSSSNELAKKYNVSRGMITKIWYDANLIGKKFLTNHSTEINLTGQTFGYLTVLYATEQRTQNGSIIWHCKCNHCGEEKDIDGTKLRNGKIISCGCIGKERLKLGRGMSPQDDKTGKRYGSLVVLERVGNKTIGGRSVVNYLCQCDCGRQVEVLSSNLATENTQSCGRCKNDSHGNTKIDLLLTKAQIPFIREYRFKDCRDINPLPFDFYVNNQYLIEYDGKQHYQDNGFYNSKKIQQHDKIKSEWCKNNHIPLIRIPYIQFNNLCLEDLLLETSNFIE